LIGLDTNVVLRYLLDDGGSQSRAAVSLIDDMCSEASPGHVGWIVLAELWWVLSRGLKLRPGETADTIRLLLNNSHLRIHRPDAVIAALETSSRTDADFADCLIVLENQDAGAAPTASFDRGALDAGIMQPVPQNSPPA
jgi:predicted nucleic-acid-binding protein